MLQWSVLCIRARDWSTRYWTTSRTFVVVRIEVGTDRWPQIRSKKASVAWPRSRTESRTGGAGRCPVERRRKTRNAYISCIQNKNYTITKLYQQHYSSFHHSSSLLFYRQNCQYTLFTVHLSLNVAMTKQDFFTFTMPFQFTTEFPLVAQKRLPFS